MLRAASAVELIMGARVAEEEAAQTQVAPQIQPFRLPRVGNVGQEDVATPEDPDFEMTKTLRFLCRRLCAAQD